MFYVKGIYWQVSLRYCCLRYIQALTVLSTANGTLSHNNLWKSTSCTLWHLPKPECYPQPSLITVSSHVKESTYSSTLTLTATIHESIPSSLLGQGTSPLMCITCFIWGTSGVNRWPSTIHCLLHLKGVCLLHLIEFYIQTMCPSLKVVNHECDVKDNQGCWGH